MIRVLPRPRFPLQVVLTTANEAVAAAQPYRSRLFALHRRPRAPGQKAVPAVRSPPRARGSLPAAATPPSPTPPGGPGARAPRPRVSPAAAKEFGSSKWPPRRSPSSERLSKGRAGGQVGRLLATAPRGGGRRRAAPVRRGVAGSGAAGSEAAGRRRRERAAGGRTDGRSAERGASAVAGSRSRPGSARRGEGVEAARRMAFGAGEGKRRRERRVCSGRVRLPPRWARPARSAAERCPPRGEPTSPSRGLSRYEECRRWLEARSDLSPAAPPSGPPREWRLPAVGAARCFPRASTAQRPPRRSSASLGWLGLVKRFLCSSFLPYESGRLRGIFTR